MMRRITGILALIMAAVLLSGCASDGKEAANAFNVVFCASYVDSEAVKAMGEVVKAELPEQHAKAVDFTAVSTGDPDVDPMAAMAGVVKLSAMIAAKEVDVVIADMENAARNARAEAFYPLSELLTEAELTEVGERGLSFDQVDEQGNPTGEKTAVCGIDVTQTQEMQAMFGGKPVGIFVVANAGDLEAAKSVMRAIALKD